MGGGKQVLAPESGVLGTADQPLQHLALQLCALRLVALQLAPAWRKQISCYACNAH